jgi:hypothetical protein
MIYVYMELAIPCKHKERLQNLLKDPDLKHIQKCAIRSIIQRRKNVSSSKILDISLPGDGKKKRQ